MQTMRRFLVTAAAAATLALPAAAQASPGDLDGTFSVDGLATGAQPAPAGGVAVAPDGSVVVAGETGEGAGFAVLRYTATGEPSWTRSLPGTGSAIEAEPGGTLLAGGSEEPAGNFTLARLRGADGGLEPSFGDAGVARTSFGSGDARLTDVAVGADGTIAAAGIVAGAGGDRIGVARYASDGEPLPGFASAGTWEAPEGGGFGTDVSVAVLADGSTLVAGAGPAPDGSGIGDVLVLKLTPTGDLASDFGGTGWMTIDVDGRDDARSLAVQADGRILVGFNACAFGLHTSCDPSVAALTPDGELDPAFGDGGIVVGAPGFEVADGGAGRVLVAGTTAPLEHFARDFALARLRADGSLDPAFASGSAAAVDFGLTTDIATSLAVGPDGRPAVAGQVRDVGHGVARFAVAGGPPDADADGRLDAEDRCPRRFSRHETGCPQVERKLKLRKRGRRLVARVRSDLSPCTSGRQVRLLRKRGKRWRVVARRRTNENGSVKLARKPRAGRYRAVVGASVAPELARCSKARSKPVRVR